MDNCIEYSYSSIIPASVSVMGKMTFGTCITCVSWRQGKDCWVRFVVHVVIVTQFLISCVNSMSTSRPRYMRLTATELGRNPEAFNHVVDLSTRPVIIVVLGSAQGEVHDACGRRQVLGNIHHPRLATNVSVMQWSLAPSYVAVHASSAPAPAANTDFCPL